MKRKTSGLILIVFLLVACTTNKTSDFRKVNAKRLVSEVVPEASKPCFEGAYYRKLVSGYDYWLGIEGSVVLPNIQFDESRKHPRKPMQYLDNPSVYLGGNMDGQETDIGLTWEVVKDSLGNVSKDRKAFRPFLRRNEYKEQQAVFENAPAKPEYYWYPGEEVFISVRLVEDKKLRFVVKGAGKVFERDFVCEGFASTKKAEFKRVNAIDQVGNEGKPVKTTSTKVLGAVWKYTNLYRSMGGETLTMPFNNKRYTEMMCPSPTYFNVEHTSKALKRGGEALTISGNGIF